MYTDMKRVENYAYISSIFEKLWKLYLKKFPLCTGSNTYLAFLINFSTMYLNLPRQFCLFFE